MARMKHLETPVGRPPSIAPRTLPPERRPTPESREVREAREIRHVRAAPGTLLIVHAVLATVLQIAWTLLPDGTFGLSKASLQGFAVAAALMQGFCILLPTLVVAGGYRITSRMILGDGLPRPGGLILAAAAGIPAAVLLTGLNNVVIYALAKSGFLFPATSSPQVASSGPASWVVLLVLSVLVPGIVEELMFRGLIQGAMQRTGARASAVVLPALAFALFHADPLFLLAPFGAGLLLGALRARTGSLAAPIAAHVSLNLTLVLIRPLLPQWRDAAFASGFDAEALLGVSVLGAVVAGVAAIPVYLAFRSPAFRHPPVVANEPAPRQEPKVFLDWRFFAGCLLLAFFLVWLYAFSLAQG
jgi:membrane protease YdiL (CAAX protease family)